ncbi:MAG: DUF3365 domain-containing protein [Nitrospirae bacterium]|nr:MAG: DUF3365 domain-containing protein [Nitrospirota bacterium]
MLMPLPGLQWVRERSVGTKLVILLLPIIAGFVLALEWYFAWHRDMARVEESVRQQAQMVATQIMADRTYYATVVIPLIAQNGVAVTDRYHDMPGAVPLPVTFLREVSEAIRDSQKHYTAALLSPWPINKNQGLRDPFQQESFAYLSQHRDGVFSRIEVVNGQRTLRFMKGDFASAQVCVDCHNAHPDSPKHDFQLNDLMGGMEIQIPIESWLIKVRRDEGMLLMWGAGICILLVGVIWYGVHRIVTKPLGVLTRLMKTLLTGSTGLPSSTEPHGARGSESRDEVKSLWKAFAEMEQIIKRQHGELQWTNVKLKEQVAERTALLQRTLHAWLKTEQSARGLIQASPMPIILTQPDGRIEAINEPALQGFEYDAVAVAGKPITLLIAEPDWLRVVAQLRQEADPQGTSGKPLAVQLQGLRKSGRRFLVQAALSIIGQTGDQRLLITMPDLNDIRPSA